MPPQKRFSLPFLCLPPAPSQVCYCSQVMLDSVRDEMYIYIKVRIMEDYFFLSISSSKPYRNQHSSHLFQSLPSYISIFRSITHIPRALSLEKSHHVVE